VQLTELIVAYGHKNVKATHKSTFEITKDKELSVRGDCIIAVSADKGLFDLRPGFKELLRRENAKLTIVIDAGTVTDTVKAFGSSRLILSHPTDIVVRKSDFICHRTLAVRADKAACDLSRALVEKLKNPEQVVKITLTVEV
jgi:hypothetical protein